DVPRLLFVRAHRFVRAGAAAHVGRTPDAPVRSVDQVVHPERDVGHAVQFGPGESAGLDVVRDEVGLGVEADDRRAGPLGVAEVDDLPGTGEDLTLRVGDDGLLPGHHVERVQRKTLFTGDRVVDLVVHDRAGPVVDHARHLVDDFGLQRPGVVPPG